MGDEGLKKRMRHAGLLCLVDKMMMTTTSHVLLCHYRQSRLPCWARFLLLFIPYSWGKTRRHAVGVLILLYTLTLCLLPKVYVSVHVYICLLP